MMLMVLMMVGMMLMALMVLGMMLMFDHVDND